MKRSFLLVLAAGLILAASAFAGGQGEGAAPKGLPDSIVVGCLEPLTGAHAIFGTEAKVGMEIAVRHINEAGGINHQGLDSRW
jgi:ABC-type branched-subunit amino acid transport system substrate-binding protein